MRKRRRLAGTILTKRFAAVSAMVLACECTEFNSATET
jgi:hypothetical protein